MGEVHLAVDARYKLGEGPVWDPADGALWWVDIEGRLLQRHVPATGETRRWEMPERIGSFALRERGGVVAALAGGFAFVDLDPDLVVQRVEQNIGVPNSLAWSSDDRTLYLADTMRPALYAYDFDPATGGAANRRAFAERAGQPGFPDGSTVDAEGYLWNARWDGWRVVRFAPDGRVDRVVELPVQKPTSCAFGGPDLATLYVTSAVWDLAGEALAAQPWAGGVLAVEVGVRGLPEPRFRG